jgi:hypothetical protein
MFGEKKRIPPRASRHIQGFAFWQSRKRVDEKLGGRIDSIHALFSLSIHCRSKFFLFSFSYGKQDIQRATRCQASE